MTYGTLKHKIFALLDVDSNTQMTENSALALVSSALPYTADAVARKVALHLKNIVCTATLSFEKGAVGVQATLPDEAFGLKEICKGGRAYGAESFTLIGKNIIFFEQGEGSFTVSYYAFPVPITEETEDDTVLPYDDFAADIVAYGTAGELSHMLYPTDMARYMRLMTEYDERISASVKRFGEKALQNTFFGKRRGVR